MIVVDTSIWADHLRIRIPRLSTLLDDDEALMHPYVVGELALGNLADRARMLALFASMPQAPVAKHGEAMTVIDRRRLGGRGIGYVDVHLLTSAALVGGRLWTRDRRLAAVAAEFDMAYTEP